MKRSVSQWRVLVATASVMGLLLPGCAWSVGGQKEGKAVVQPTRGQELIDLKKAKDQGAISEDEYQAQRKAILEK